MRIVASICGVVLASCSRETGSSPFLAGQPNGVPALGARQSFGAFGRQTGPDTASFKHLFSFNDYDGEDPEATLINVKGLLYGSAAEGGASDGQGLVFTITPSGTERVLYTFHGGPSDGANPGAPLLDVKGVLYGTTPEGGANNYGAVFSLTRTGHERVLYSFTGEPDGSNPGSGLIAVNGLLYGTTVVGGAEGSGGFGTVFTITPSGVEHVIHSFGGAGDGAYPSGNLIDVDGLLYGTTSEGGSGSGGADGTVFAITPSGYERVLYNFNGGADGRVPYDGLTYLKGKLYGTTDRGGAADCGTVFSVKPTGHEHVLYRFKGGTDGCEPHAGLTAVKGKLYGVTSKDGGSPADSGVIFSITRLGHESKLYNFAGGVRRLRPPGRSDRCKGRALWHHHRRRDYFRPWVGNSFRPVAVIVGTARQWNRSSQSIGAYSMRIVILVLYGIVFASCSRETGSSPFLASPPNGASVLGARQSVDSFGRRTEPETSRFRHLFSFNGADGGYPSGNFTDLRGLLYGSTTGGGASNFGSIFTITRYGRERLLYSFKGGSDGANPQGGLLKVKGLLYGTTSGAGASDGGTVFTITPSGYESVLYSFGGTSDDGSSPFATLLNVKGLLYGTTYNGGAVGYGTVFTITPSGHESVLHSFNGVDGATPIASLIDVNGVIYGTTEYGGANDYGTVFTITPAGNYNLLYSFKGGNDGANPWAPLLNVKGLLYGTTYFGGASNKGTVFTITPSGNESVLYSFTGGTDGASPLAGLTEANGELYGTTHKEGGGPTDAGTVFTITSSGGESVLHDFQGGTDGASPLGLIAIKGKLYGATEEAGANNEGTVFKVTP